MFTTSTVTTSSGGTPPPRSWGSSVSTAPGASVGPSTAWPAVIASGRRLPSRATSAAVSATSAMASGTFSRSPRARRDRASSAAVNSSRRSLSDGVGRILPLVVKLVTGSAGVVVDDLPVQRGQPYRQVGEDLRCGQWPAGTDRELVVHTGKLRIHGADRAPTMARSALTAPPPRPPVNGGSSVIDDGAEMYALVNGTVNAIDSPIDYRFTGRRVHHIGSAHPANPAAAVRNHREECAYAELMCLGVTESLLPCRAPTRIAVAGGTPAPPPASRRVSRRRDLLASARPRRGDRLRWRSNPMPDPWPPRIRRQGPLACHGRGSG
ncbi:MAG: hypothetical protein JWP76_2175 [Dactylosporangium sp.]|nr:hypothetical protein [Dactylosporangium sp.]